MPFQFKDASCVAVGTFNIYVIQPAWLMEVGLLPEDVEGIELQTDLTQPGFRMELGDVVWRVEPTRLTLQTSNPSVNCGSTLATICEKLPWTPLRAVGVNGRYEAPASEYEELLYDWSHPASRSQLPKGFSLDQFTWHAAVRNETYLFSLQMTWKGDTLVASTNVHADLAGQRGKAKDVANSFCALQQTAVSLMENLFSVKINHDAAED